MVTQVNETTSILVTEQGHTKAVGIGGRQQDIDVKFKTVFLFPPAIQFSLRSFETVSGQGSTLDLTLVNGTLANSGFSIRASAQGIQSVTINTVEVAWSAQGQAKVP